MQGGWKIWLGQLTLLSTPCSRPAPLNYVQNIKAPVLYMGAMKDTLCPMSVIEKAVGLTPRAALYAAECSHFELFTGEHLPALQQRQLDWLLDTIGLPAAQPQQAVEPADDVQDVDMEVAAA